MSTAATGTWFSSGYHGHFRSKSRNDFVNEYRQKAKPKPPGKFTVRVKSGHREHKFSKHDNRHSFLQDALYFEEGLGKKKLKNKTFGYKPDFIMWTPQRQDFQNAGPLLSTYRKDFHTKQEPMKQVYVESRPKTAFGEKMTTSYRYSHSHNKPDRETISAMNNEGLLPIGIKKNQGRIQSATGYRDSVSSCMTWHPHNSTTQSSLRPQVPYSTQTAPAQLETFAPPPQTQVQPQPALVE
ncbi:unnamed protein product [Owenia fusiformis]|uniref:Uncharacterized protein n=1 Tax=Owenia fusiformis TaxID=6347 RepID=A0A8J1XFY1_OWEFU|nr:unnamed protein product [Owenia fusiformis]